MSEEKHHPVFASKFIKQFTHDPKVSDILQENLEWNEKENIATSILPIINQVSVNKKGIVRIFIWNKGEKQTSLDVRYNLSGWFSDLGKMENQQSITKLFLKPGEVYYRDISFKTDIKQGKNYFQLILKKEVDDKTAIITDYIEYIQTRKIEDLEQIERNNFLGLSSKPYINPNKTQHWVYYSLFGGWKYNKEPIVFLFLKIIFFLSSSTLIGLSLYLENIPEYVLPLSVIGAIIGFFSFFSDVDRKTVNHIHDLSLSDTLNKGGLEYIPDFNPSWNFKYAVMDINYNFSKQTNTFSWKTSANKKYKNMIEEIAEIIDFDINVAESSPEDKKKN